jgi:beta-galactosidase/beta-glucuronidase
MGVLNWQLNDWWPTYSDSSIDHALNLKAAMYAARRFNKPLVAFLDSRTNSEFDSVATVVWDLPKAITGRLVVTRRKIVDGAEVEKTVYPFSFDGAGVKTFGKKEKEDQNTFLVLSVEAQDALGVVYRNSETETVSKIVKTPLPSPGVAIESVKAVENGDFEVTVSAKAPSFATMLIVEDDAGGTFDDNFVTLLKGSRTFRYTPGAKMTVAQFRSKLYVRNLKDALISNPVTGSSGK